MKMSSNVSGEKVFHIQLTEMERPRGRNTLGVHERVHIVQNIFQIIQNIVKQTL